ncbi:MAG: YdcF family protein [Saprospiraceae bacterium]
MKQWEGSIIAVDDIDEEYDYIILLGGFSAQKDSKPKGFWLSERGSRLTSALELLQKRKGKQLLISGGTGSIWNTDRLPEAQYNRNYLVDIGIPDSLIIMENKSVNTYENALYTKEILDRCHPNPKCLLVTSAFHIRRSMGLFEKMGMDVTPFPTDYLHSEFNRPNNIIVPNPKAIHGWEMLLKEWVGIITYKVKGQI